MRHAISIFVCCLALCSLEAEPRYVQLSHQIIRRVDKEIIPKYKLTKDGSGGRMFRELNAVCASYECPYELTPEEAQLLFVDICEQILSHYNASKEVRPYLSNYPFEPHNVELDISFNLANGADKQARSYVVSDRKKNVVCWPIGNERLPKYTRSYDEILQELKG